ncbi:hypothetical protein [Staphylococcus phage vB_SauH_DELF3]|nr:hypothetical protein [Staphylococcus phage vB_SauH_DELF3]
MITFSAAKIATSKNRQVPKHYKQRTNQEIIICKHLSDEADLKNNFCRLTNHCHVKCKKPVNFKAFANPKHNKNVDLIEYLDRLDNNNIKRRVVVRHFYVVQVRFELSYHYLVIEVKTGESVASYLNRVTVSLKTLNLDDYDNQTLKIKS